MATKKGTNQGDMLKGTDGDDVLLGRNGDDTLFGSDGNDRLDGGNGADELIGGDGNDLFLPGRADGADSMVGGKGIDTVSYANFSTTEGVYIDFFTDGGQQTKDDAAGDAFFSIERFIGTNASDWVSIRTTATNQRGYVFGGDGDDDIFVKGGVMRGGDGNDDLLADPDRNSTETLWLELDGDTNRIYNFTDGQDRLRISGKEFGIGATLNTDEFFLRISDVVATGTKAQFIFLNSSDELYFDRDGTGSDAAVLVMDFDQTSPLSGLTIFDFDVV